MSVNVSGSICYAGIRIINNLNTSYVTGVVAAKLAKSHQTPSFIRRKVNCCHDTTRCKRPPLTLTSIKVAGRLLMFLAFDKTQLRHLCRQISVCHLHLFYKQTGHLQFVKSQLGVLGTWTCVNQPVYLSHTLAKALGDKLMQCCQRPSN